MHTSVAELHFDGTWKRDLVHVDRVLRDIWQCEIQVSTYALNGRRILCMAH